MPAASVPSGRARRGRWQLLAGLVLGGSALAGCSRDGATGPANRPTRIAFTSIDIASGRGAIYTMSPDGSSLQRLSDTASDEILPVLSPDGGRIAFVAGVRGVAQIHVMSVSGLARVPLTASELGAFFPSWTPDGQHIVFYNDDDVKTWIVGADGSGARPISTSGDDEQTPALSPDGRRIAFVTARHFTDSRQLFELYVMDVDGTHETRLTNTSTATRAINGYPAWSPDGSRIAFIRTVDGSVPHVFVMNADGGGLRQVFATADRELGVTWSPDGRELLFVRDVGGVPDLFIANVDGSGARNVTHTPNAAEQFPSWGKAP